MEIWTVEIWTLVVLRLEVGNSRENWNLERRCPVSRDAGSFHDRQAKHQAQRYPSNPNPTTTILIHVDSTCTLEDVVIVGFDDVVGLDVWLDGRGMNATKRGCIGS